nr:hypothetical protein [Micromonospora sp. DSM 115978]
MSSLTSASDTVGPPPPFDTELGAALDAFGGLIPPAITPQMLTDFKAAVMPPVPDDELSRDGAFDV